MPTRPTPSDFAALIPDPNAPACDQLSNYFQMTKLFSTWVNTIYNNDGTFTQDFLNSVCATGCGGGGGSSTTTNGGSQSLNQVTDLAMPEAYLHDEYEYYRLRWSTVAAATKYSVHRNTVNNFSTSTQVIAATTLYPARTEWSSAPTPVPFDCGDYCLFLDPVARGTLTNVQYFYWVRAFDDAGNYSPPSNVASGRRFRNYTYASIGALGSYVNPASPFVVSAGNSKAVISILGGGGGGAGGSYTDGGGSGGGGGFILGEVNVAAGNEFYVDFESNTGTAANSTNGSVGPATILYFRAASINPWIEIARGLGAGGGVYAGAGGVGSSSTFDPAYFLNVTQYSGTDGGAATTELGELSYTGASFYARRYPNHRVFDDPVPAGMGWGSGEGVGSGGAVVAPPTFLLYALGGDSVAQRIDIGLVV